MFGRRLCRSAWTWAGTTSTRSTPSSSPTTRSSATSTSQVRTRRPPFNSTQWGLIRFHVAVSHRAGDDTAVVRAPARLHPWGVRVDQVKKSKKEVKKSKKKPAHLKDTTALCVVVTRQQHNLPAGRASRHRSVVGRDHHGQGAPDDGTWITAVIIIVKRHRVVFITP